MIELLWGLSLIGVGCGAYRIGYSIGRRDEVRRRLELTRGGWKR